MDRIEELVASGKTDEAVQAVLSLPPESIESALVRISGKLRADAVPLLQALDQPSNPKVVAKSARRALHRLRSQGIAIPEVVPPPAEMGLIGGRRILRSFLSSIDGQGTQFLSILASAPMTGLADISSAQIKMGARCAIMINRAIGRVAGGFGKGLWS